LCSATPFTPFSQPLDSEIQEDNLNIRMQREGEGCPRQGRNLALYSWVVSLRQRDDSDLQLMSLARLLLTAMSQSGRVFTSSPDLREASLTSTMRSPLQAPKTMRRSYTRALSLYKKVVNYKFS
jgi:hypothetical protein